MVFNVSKPLANNCGKKIRKPPDRADYRADRKNGQSEAHHLTALAAVTRCGFDWLSPWETILPLARIRWRHVPAGMKVSPQENLEFILGHDVSNRPAIKGLKDQDLGVGLARSTAFQGGSVSIGHPIADQMRTALNTPSGNQVDFRQVPGGETTVYMIGDMFY